ncbi:hypothetical protein [Glycomyces paridis]|uniref:DUF4878 domain-containing protein n=1 Tax=Glycomyces paridis TaxID=2126555 RepID=A0A4S8PKB5_9ACTN|nr:hypothetical protein [Glycomyces paridis]THV30145.1 hypothetical protein E9998_07150 [Glycomyces paridis]
MTYPPPGGQNPQYQLQPEPQQPSDPYMQGYGSTPPPPQPGHYPPQPNYTQPPSQPMMPPVGVQPGYPTAPGTVLPPPIPPAQQGGNLTVILAVVVGLVVVLGIAAVLIIPGMMGDEDPQAGGGDDPTTGEATSEEPTAEETEAAPTEEETTEAAAAIEGWGSPISSEDDYDPNSPVGVAITYQLAYNSNDDATLESLVSADATEDMKWDLDAKLAAEDDYDFIIWGLKREGGTDSEVQAWAGWTWDDTAPATDDDLSLSYTYTLVQEDGEWKLYDLVYGAP